jgi:formate dehydrogenase subunit delta
VSSDKIGKMVHMANQIADYFKVMPEAQAISGAADHLRAFWTPKMRAEITAWAAAGGEGLTPLAAKAVGELTHDAGKLKDIATG